MRIASKIFGICCAGILLTTAVTGALGSDGPLSIQPSKVRAENIRRVAAAVPEELVGSWTWGTVNPGQYVSKTTGEYVGHAGGGAVSYTFRADGTYRRYVLVHMGAGFANENIFSVMDAKVTFNESAKTFTLRFTKGNITFEKRSGMTRKPLSREDMERGGTVFDYRLEKDEEGKKVLVIHDRKKPANEETRFYREPETENTNPSKAAAKP